MKLKSNSMGIEPRHIPRYEKRKITPTTKEIREHKAIIRRKEKIAELTPTLATCPFCGSSAKIYQKFEHFLNKANEEQMMYSFRVACTGEEADNNHCWAGYSERSIHYDTIKLAVDIWNTQVRLEDAVGLQAKQDMATLFEPGSETVALEMVDAIVSFLIKFIEKDKDREEEWEKYLELESSKEFIEILDTYMETREEQYDKATKPNR